jgi:aminoglycoside phosphotransferase (APT) family kinase protein
MAPADHDLPAELLGWVAECAGGPVVEVRRQARWRPTYFLDVDAPHHDTVVLKMARAPRHVIERSALLSTFNTGREALLLRVLAGSGVPVPPLVAFHEASGSLLMDKVDGSAQLHGVDDRGQVRAIAEDFAAKLAALHAIELDRHEIASTLSIPESAEELALGNFLQYAETDLDTVLRRRPALADPLLTLARGWAHRSVPPFERAPRIVQGDCGPDQFLFDGTRVTAIIDWELAHIGDPMVDLGAMRLRECLYPAGMFPIVLDRYRELGMPVDEPAIRYYTVVTILFTLFGTIGGTVRLDPRNDEVIQQLWWQVSLRRALCEAIAEAEGLELARPEPVEAVDDADTRLHALLGDRLHHLAQRGEPFASELRSTLALADAITNAQRGRGGREATRRDIEACLGASSDDLDHAMRQLDDRIRERPDDGFEQVLQALYGMTVREQLAWLPLMRADRWSEDAGEMTEDLREEHEALGLTPL